MVVGLNFTSYEGKMAELGITSLQERRIRGDMIQVWKYLHGHNPGGDALFRQVDEQPVRVSRHTAKIWNICRVESNLDTRKNFFTVRCVNKWNNLPRHVQGAEDLNGFKNAYDKFVRSSRHSSL